MNKLLSIYIALFFSLISVKVLAACSAYVGDATLNEIMKKTGNNGDAFIEIKLLDTSISSAIYNDWKLKICHDEGNGRNKSSQCKSISVAAMTDTTSPWIWGKYPTIDRDFIDFKDGFDLSLLDNSDQFIDYIQIDNYSGQNFTSSCSYNDLEYVFTIPNDIENGTKILLRKPDGTGEWEESKNLNEFPPSPGEGNDGDSIIDHFEIDTLDGQGITCEADQIIIKACADASCSTVNPDAVDVKLSINGVENKTVTVSGNNGTSTSYSYTTVGNAALSLDQDYECKDSNSKPCIVDFKDSGFRFYENTETNPIPTQVSAKPSSTLKIQAIEKNPDTGACQAAFIDTTAIEMAATCVDPIACAGSQVAINNLITTDNITTLNKDSVLSYSPVNLDFSDDTVNSAEFIFTYPDAGKVQLHARYNIPDENGDPSGNYMLGSSNEFVVRPFGFFIDVVDNPKAQSANQPNSVFKKAGVEFTTSLTAVQWQAEDDIDEDGVPDTSADLIDNSTTVNFGNETTPETAIITDSLYLPNLGVEGNLTNVDFTDFNDGIATNGVINNKSMTYDEVGIVNFTANLTSGAYLGASDVIGVEPYVGRFIPDHFELSTGFDGSIISVCDIDSPSSEMTFAYTGQMSSIDDTKGALQYESALQPELLITAKSSICPDDECTTTQNYTGDFIKFSAEDVEYIIPLEDATLNKVGSLGDTIKLLANLSEGTLPEEANGVITYAFNVNDNFVYLHEQNAEISPFPSLIELGISKIKDSDDVLAIDSDDDTDNNRLWVLKPTSKEIRFGRVQLENSYGPETSDLPQPLSVNYFKEGQYVLSEDDNCTRYDSSKLTIIDISLINFSSVPPLPDITSVTDKFINETPPGETRAIELIAPGTGNTGQVCVSYDIYPWLQYEWAIDEDNLQCPFVKADVDGLFNDNPRAVATFGIYRGNDRIIYQREVSR